MLSLGKNLDNIPNLHKLFLKIRKNLGSIAKLINLLKFKSKIKIFLKK